MRRFGRDAGGQSFVEVALALPILMLLVLGIADLGRFAVYGIAVTHAAQEAAAFAVQHVDATDGDVRLRVCGQLSLDTPMCTGLTVDCARGADLCATGRVAPTVRVSVRFDLPLLTGLIAARLGLQAIPLRADATLAGYTQ